ncbi:MAG: hypothetical protein NWF13_07025 [Candidatus Bathyarchaeota archaeon]|nr:hypothetical protein [Candidatus Bathyarchaeota archaeon]
MPIVGVYAQPALELLWDLPGHFIDVAVSANGQYLVASNGSHVNFYAYDSAVPLWSHNVGGPHFYPTVMISADGSEVVVGFSAPGFDGIFYFTEATILTGNPDPAWTSINLVGFVERGTLDISDDGETVVVVGTGPNVMVWTECTSKTGDDNVPDHADFIPANLERVDMTPNGRYIAVAGIDQGEDPPTVNYYVLFYEVTNDLELLWLFNPKEEDGWFQFQDLAVSDDGYGVVASWVLDFPFDSQMSGVFYFNQSTTVPPNGPADREPSWGWEEPDWLQTTVAISGDGDEVVYGSWPGPPTLCFWNMSRTRSGLEEPSFHDSVPTLDVAISENGQYTAALIMGEGIGLVLVDFESMYSDGYLLTTLHSILSMSRNAEVIAVVDGEFGNEFSLNVFQFNGLQLPVGGEILSVNPLQSIAPILLSLIAAIATVGLLLKKRSP